MSQPLGRAELATEAAATCRVMENLERDEDARAQVARFPHDSHCALAEALEELVLAEASRGHCGSSGTTKLATEDSGVRRFMRTGTQGIARFDGPAAAERRRLTCPIPAETRVHRGLAGSELAWHGACSIVARRAAHRRDGEG
jgi:hypothetical protein